ncbi:MAG: HEPN domain-containing protein [Bryobacteraceae bacterium]|nr:HEPN domain-containing protein [Bryobacteraceae bacterium]
MAKSADDLNAARILTAGHLDEPALYHCQQSGEKTLKAFLTWHQTPFRKTHSLKELGESCAQIDPTLEALAVAAHALTDFAWKTRYPDLYLIEEGAVPAMIELAAEILYQIQSRLPAESESESSAMAITKRERAG